MFERLLQRAAAALGAAQDVVVAVLPQNDSRALVVEGDTVRVIYVCLPHVACPLNPVSVQTGMTWILGK